MAETTSSSIDSDTVNKIFEGCKAIASEKNQAGMYFILADANGTEIGTDCVPNTPAIVLKEGRCKVNAMVHGKELIKPASCFSGLCCFVLPAVCCGADYAIGGGVWFTHEGQKYIAAANGASDPWLDETCIVAGLKAAGIEPDDYPKTSPNAQNV